MKRGHVLKNWKLRWLVLKDEYLYYFENEKSPGPKGFILLRGAEVSRYQDPDQPDLGFKISVENDSTRVRKIRKFSSKVVLNFSLFSLSSIGHTT